MIPLVIPLFGGLQQFGVIPFEIRTLKKPHTEQRRTRRIVYNKAIVDTEAHRWCVEKQRIFASFINTLVYFITKQWFARFLKNIYYQNYQQYVHYGSVALYAFGTSVILYFMLSPPCSPTLCVTFICSRLTLSLQIPEESDFLHIIKNSLFIPK